MFKNKRYLALLLAALLLIGLVGCKSEDLDEPEDKVEVGVAEKEEAKEEEDVEVESIEASIASLKGPTTIGLAKIIDENDLDYMTLDFNMHVMPEEIAAGLSKGEIDIAAIPANLAASLYNKTEGEVQVAAINTLSVLYIVENGETIETIDDLEGKTIYSIGKGTTPEGVLNGVIEGNDLKDVKIEFKQEPAEIAALLNGEEDVIAMLPEPFVSVVSTKNDKVRRVFNMNEEWEKVNDGSPQVTGVLVVRKEFAEENKKQLDLFLDDYKESIAYAETNLEDLAPIIEDLEIIPQGLGEKSIANIDMKYIDGDEMEDVLSKYLENLFNFEPKLVGGQVPDEGFYYKK